MAISATTANSDCNRCTSLNQVCSDQAIEIGILKKALAQAKAEADRLKEALAKIESQNASSSAQATAPAAAASTAAPNGNEAHSQSSQAATPMGAASALATTQAHRAPNPSSAAAGAGANSATGRSNAQVTAPNATRNPSQSALFQDLRTILTGRTIDSLATTQAHRAPNPNSAAAAAGAGANSATGSSNVQAAAAASAAAQNRRASNPYSTTAAEARAVVQNLGIDPRALYGDNPKALYTKAVSIATGFSSLTTIETGLNDKKVTELKRLAAEFFNLHDKVMFSEASLGNLSDEKVAQRYQDKETARGPLLKAMIRLISENFCLAKPVA